METTLREALGYDEETGAYQRPHLLRRWAQLAIAYDRGISGEDIAKRLGVSREAVRLYFQGSLHQGGKEGVSLRTIEAGQGFHGYRRGGIRHTSRSSREISRRRAQRLRIVAKCRRFEDAVERALEDISRERDLSPPRVIGTPEETYLQSEVITRDLMKAPHQTSRTKELI